MGKKRSRAKTPQRRSTRNAKRSRKGEEHDQYLLNSENSPTSTIITGKKTDTLETPNKISSGSDEMIRSTPFPVSAETPQRKTTEEVDLRTEMSVGETVNEVTTNKFPKSVVAVDEKYV